MGQPDIIASYWTLAGQRLPHEPNIASPIPIRQRIEAAGKAGFAGMGFAFDDIAAARAQHGDDELRAMFAANGIRLIELEALMDWFADGERGERAAAQRRVAFDQVRALGAFQIKVAGDLAGDWPLDRMAEAFARLCDEARADGLRITLELLPISNLPDVTRTMQVVGAAGRPNGGMMFDAWHVARGHIPLADIAALPPGLCAGVEFDDGPHAPEMPDLYEEMIHCRRLPGEGEFDLAGLIAATRAASYDGPYGIEILSHAHRALPVEQAAVAAYESVRRVLI